MTVKKSGKTPRYDFATEGQKVAATIAPDIWHEARRGMSERPRPGHIFVLAARGSKVDKAAAAAEALQSAEGEVGLYEQKLEAARNAAKHTSAFELSHVGFYSASSRTETLTGRRRG